MMPLKNHNFIVVSGDTDSIAFKKQDESPFSIQEQESILQELNKLMPEFIVWKNDSHYRRVIICKAKNYVLDDGKKIIIKGSGLKATKKEPALKECIKEVINLLLNDRKDQIIFTYLKYCKMIIDLKDINQWCFKATITKKVLDPKTTFNKKIKDAIKGTGYHEGDKVYLYFKEDLSLSLRENYQNDCDISKLLGKLNDTFQVFNKVFDVELVPDLTLKRNQSLLETLKPTKVIPLTNGTFTRPLNADPRIQVR